MCTWMLSSLRPLADDCCAEGRCWGSPHEERCARQRPSLLSPSEAGAANLSHSYQLTTRKGQTLHRGTDRRSRGEWYCCSQLLLSLYNEKWEDVPALKAQKLRYNTCLPTLYRFISSSGNGSSSSQICSIQVLNPSQFEKTPHPCAAPKTEVKMVTNWP